MPYNRTYSSRINRMIRGGVIDKPYLWVDAYNGIVSDEIYGTLTTRISSSNHYFVSVPILDSCFDKDLQRTMIAKFIPNADPRLFDIRKLTPVECFRLMGVPDNYIARMTDNPSILSKSACYKLAGNSIVCDVLFYIYKNIWMYEPTTGSQFSIFDYGSRWDVPLPKKINVVTLCSGYDSQMIAMEMLHNFASLQGKKFDYELKAWAEFDPESKAKLENQPAVKAHNLNFPQWADRNVGDMTTADWSKIDVGEGIDLLTYSTPCQSISVAGKRAGIKKGSGTRSAVLWSTENAIRALKPKFLLQENVAALIDSTNWPDFVEWYNTVKACGYHSYYQILNAKNYGVPQNRARVFMVSVRDDVCKEQYQFPKPFKLEKCIADILQENVADTYFLKPESVIAFLSRNQKEKAEYRVVPDEMAELIKTHAYAKSDLEKLMKVNDDKAIAELYQYNQTVEKPRIIFEVNKLLRNEPIDIKTLLQCISQTYPSLVG